MKNYEIYTSSREWLEYFYTKNNYNEECEVKWSKCHFVNCKTVCVNFPILK